MNEIYFLVDFLFDLLLFTNPSRVSFLLKNSKTTKSAGFKLRAIVILSNVIMVILYPFSIRFTCILVSPISSPSCSKVNPFFLRFFLIFSPNWQRKSFEISGLVATYVKFSTKVAERSVFNVPFKEYDCFFGTFGLNKFMDVSSYSHGL